MDQGGGPPEGITEAILFAADAANMGIAVSALPDGNATADTIVNLWINDAGCRILGRSREQVLGASAFFAIPEEERSRLHDQRARRLAGEQFDAQFEHNAIHGDGHLVPLRVSVHYVTVRGRKLVVSLFVDQTRRREELLALEESEKRFRTLVEGAPDGVAIVRGGTMIYVNPALVSMLGYERAAELEGRDVAELLQPVDVPAAHERLQFVARKGRLPTRDYPVRRRDGAQLLLEVTSFGSEYEGSPAVIVFIRDVTERAALEAQLARTDRLAALGTLAAGVAHEINNPLTFVSLGLDALQPIVSQAALDPQTQERAQTLFDEIRRGAERVAAIVRDLRAFTRFDEARGPVDLSRVLQSAERIAAHEVRSRAELIVSATELPPVLATAGRLEQVFVNLLVNAAQALPEGGRDNRVELRARFEQAQEDALAHVVVEVRDNGPGIPPDILPRVFDPFFTTKAPGVGTGLGLSICHAIVTRLGGDISIDSRVGKGTVVRVRLPVAETRLPAVAAARATSTDRRARILVVDDETPLALTLRCVLEERHEVETATSGDEAIAKLLQGELFDLVLCDLAMPGLSGAQVFERVIAQRPELEDRFVFMTGGAYTPKMQTFLDAHPQRTLHKPFPISAVEEILSAMLKE